jgi:Holliday junction resolvase-like predicted endonuclease
MNKKEIGDLGEKIAEKELLKNGYKIIGRNIKGKLFELDIVCFDPGGIIVFCEVKTMTMTMINNPEYYLMPEDNLSGKKLRNIKRGCEIFLAKYPYLLKSERGWQIDLIAITLECDNQSGRWFAGLRHYKNIY